MAECPRPESHVCFLFLPSAPPAGRPLRVFRVIFRTCGSGSFTLSMSLLVPCLVRLYIRCPPPVWLCPSSHSAVLTRVPASLPAERAVTSTGPGGPGLPFLGTLPTLAPAAQTFRPASRAPRLLQPGSHCLHLSPTLHPTGWAVALAFSLCISSLAQYLGFLSTL